MSRPEASARVEVWADARADTWGSAGADTPVDAPGMRARATASTLDW
ncbi:hypothetical protein ACFWNE_30190 [Streptomyces goshikiensis]